VEVKVGVQHSNREIVLESAQSSDELTKAVAAAVESGGLLQLQDDKGRIVMIPVDKLAYIEVGSPERGRVGFGA
jgi:hypothetical protein